MLPYKNHKSDVKSSKSTPQIYNTIHSFITIVFVICTLYLIYFEGNKDIKAEEEHEISIPQELEEDSIIKYSDSVSFLF